MTKKTIEFYVIKEEISEYNEREAEYFDTFEEARSHINDTDENGRYKYCGYWTDSQECSICRKFINPQTKTMITTDTWVFKKGKLINHYNF